MTGVRKSSLALAQQMMVVEEEDIVTLLDEMSDCGLFGPS